MEVFQLGGLLDGQKDFNRNETKINQALNNLIAKDKTINRFTQRKKSKINRQLKAFRIKPINFDQAEKKTYQSLIKVLEDFSGRKVPTQIIASTSNMNASFEKSSAVEEFKKVSKAKNNISLKGGDSLDRKLESETMDNYEIKVDSVVKNKGVDLFKIISNRYMKVMPELEIR